MRFLDPEFMIPLLEKRILKEERDGRHHRSQSARAAYLEAAEELAKQGIEAGKVIDPRTLVPFDYEHRHRGVKNRPSDRRTRSASE